MKKSFLQYDSGSLSKFLGSPMKDSNIKNTKILKHQPRIQFSQPIIIFNNIHCRHVPPPTLRSGLSALGSGSQSFEEGSHLCFMYLKKKEKKEKRKTEQCHKLLLVLGGGDLAPTRSYSERWQVYSSNWAVCGALKN